MLQSNRQRKMLFGDTSAPIKKTPPPLPRELQQVYDCEKQKTRAVQESAGQKERTCLVPC